MLKADKSMKNLTEKIIDYLCDRNGFDNWWYNIDEETQEEIKKGMEKQLKFKPLLVLKVSDDFILDDYLDFSYKQLANSMPEYNHIIIYCNQDNKFDVEFYHCDNMDEITEKKVNELINLTMQNNG